MKNIPNNIFLQIDADGQTPENFNELQATWSTSKVFKNDIEYLRKPILSLFTDWTNQQTLWVYTVIKKAWINSNDYTIEITTEEMYNEYLKTVK